MKKFVVVLAVALMALVSCSKGDDDPRLVIITFDGLRWQELFSGADEALVGNPKYVRNPSALQSKYWRDTPEERRSALMPFVWSYVPEHGYLIGNREKNSFMKVDNQMSFSYPGYSEMFCGWADDERINSNDPVPNPNQSVLEVVNQDPRYKGKVMMYSSWESIRFAVNNEVRTSLPSPKVMWPISFRIWMRVRRTEASEAASEWTTSPMVWRWKPCGKIIPRCFT